MAIDPIGIAQSILNAASAPPRSSSASRISGSDEDDMAQVQSILAGLNQSEKQPGLLETLATVIPQAIAVAFSQNPPEMLAAQLKDRQDRQERQKERRDRVNQLGAQLQIEDILSRGRERRAEATTIRGEERQDKRVFGAELRQNVREIARFNRESGFSEKMANLSFEQNKKLAEVKFGYDKDLARINADYSKDIEKLRSSNNINEQKIGNELSFVLPLLYSGHFTGKEAATVYDKIARGEKLSPEEDKLISKANKSLRDEKYRRDIALAQAQRTPSETSLYGKAAEWAMTRASATDLGTDAQGNIYELQKDMLGNLAGPPGVQITKYLNEDQQFQYYLQRNPISKLAGIGQNSTFDIPDEKAVSGMLDEAISVARGERRSDAEIIQKLNDPAMQQKLKANPQQIQDAITRNKLNPQATGTPLPQAVTSGVSPESEAVKDITQTTNVREASVKEIAERLRQDNEKLKAANIINSLAQKLDKKKNLLKRPDTTKLSKEDIREDIQDLERRLEDAYKSHPELRPK